MLYDLLTMNYVLFTGVNITHEISIEILLRTNIVPIDNDSNKYGKYFTGNICHIDHIIIIFSESSVLSSSTSIRHKNNNQT